MRVFILIISVLLSSCQKDVMSVIIAQPNSVSESIATRTNLTAVVFLDIDCPISQYVIKPMNSIQKRHNGNLNMIGVLPGSYYSNKEKAEFVSSFGATFELKDDPKLKAVKRLDATVTPQCFLLDQAGNVLYNGALDNKYEALGRAKPMASINYLDIAINQALNKKQIEISATKPIGCLIER